MITPKQSPARGEPDWYPYYAGYPLEFANAVLSEHLSNSTAVVDPWSGSGTTTVACLQRDISSVGIDVNPVLTIIAAGRLLPADSPSDIADVLQSVINARDRSPVAVAKDDPLTTWLRPASAAHIRTLQHHLHYVLGLDAPTGYEPTRALPPVACFFYCALFATVREVLRPFRGTNPTWLRKPLRKHNRLGPRRKSLTAQFERAVELFVSRQAPWRAKSDAEGSFITGSAGSQPFPEDTFDGAVTSPPYATRIDYVQATLPELAVLGATEADVRRLRQESTGTPVVREAVRAADALSSGYASSIVNRVGSHPSKGSRHYYRPWLENYLLNLQAGLLELHRTVIKGQPICIVVQDSYYKEVHVDIQRVVAETFAALGREELVRTDFGVPHLRSRMNPRARKHLPQRKNTESLLVYA